MSFSPIVDLVLSSSAKTRLSWSIFAIMRSISDGRVDTLPVILALLVLIVSNTSPINIDLILIYYYCYLLDIIKNILIN